MSPFLEAALLAGVGGSAASMAASSEGMSPTPTGLLLWVVSVITALGVLYRFLHVKEITNGLRNLNRAFNGEPERPGFDRVPGMPERLAKIENQTHEIKGALPAMMDLIETTSREVGEVKGQVIKTDARVTEHRRRSELQADVLRADLEQRARDVDASLAARNREIDSTLAHLSEDLLRAQTWRAALHELGIQIESRETPRDEP